MLPSCEMTDALAVENVMLLRNMLSLEPITITSYNTANLIYEFYFEIIFFEHLMLMNHI